MDFDRMDYLSDYIAYLRRWAETRFRATWAWPMSFDDFAAECAEEDAQDARDHEAHIRSMSASWRYI